MPIRTGDEELDELLADGDDPSAVFRRLKVSEAKRLEGRKFCFYEPNGKCAEFIEKVGGGQTFITYFSAANGVGKTAAGANVVTHIIFGKDSDNQFFDWPLFRDWPHPKRGRIVTDPGNIPGIVAALREWMPKGKYSATKGTKSYEAHWKCGEWEFEIMSYEQNDKEFEGQTLGFVWFDEPPPESIFKACVARTRLGGIVFITATPLTGSAWMYDAFMTGNYDAVDLEGKAIRRSVAYIEADVEAACRQHGVRGHLEHEHIQKIIAEYDEDERQARIYGKFQHLTGIVFKQFSRAVHVIKPFVLNSRDFCVYEAIDPHPRNPDAVMWLAVDRKGTKYVVNELYPKDRPPTEELAARIKSKAEQYRVVRRIADPSAFIEDQHTQKSLAQRLSEYGLNYIEATKAREASDRRIADALSFVKLPDGQWLKAPEIYIFDTCHRTIFEMEHYQWDEWRGKTSENKSAKERPMDKDDHEIECLGRLLFQEPAFIPLARNVQPVEEWNPDPYQQRA